jgi:hypothetical protein
MTDNELKELVASLAVAQAKTEAAQAASQVAQDKFAADNAAGFAALREAQAKTDAQMDKTDKKLDKVAKMISGMGANQGSVAEEFFYNSLSAKPVLGGIQFDQVTPHFIVGRKGKQSEYDVVMVNGTSVSLIEVKYKAHINDLEQVHEQLKRFRLDCPQFKDYALYGGIAGLSVPNDVSKAAKAQGLFVLKRKGEALEAQIEGMRGF